jgi:branched-chain amino acid transport system substrate-binding protein
LHEREEKIMFALKRIALAFLLSGFLIAGTSLGMTAAVQAAGGEIRIGMGIPITGAHSSEAPYYVNCVKLAEKQINQAGGINGKKLRVIIIDNQSTNPGALAALNKAVEQDKVLAFIGPVKSTQILAMSDAVKSYGIPMMVGGTNETITKQGNPWLFRCRVSDGIVAAVLVKYIKEEKLTKIGVIYSNEAFGSGGADAIERNAKLQGLKVVARERFNLGDRDFTAQLLALKRAGAEVMIPYSVGVNEFARITVEYRQLGSPYKYVGPPAIAMKPVLDLSREESEGLVGFVDSVPGMNATNRRFVEAYRKTYNSEPDTQAPWSYDAVNLLSIAIRKSGGDRAKIRETILATKGYERVLGVYTFTPEGEGLNGGPIAVIKNGKPQLVKMVSVKQ